MSTIVGWIIYGVVVLAVMAIPAFMSHSKNQVLRRMGNNAFFLIVALLAATLLAMKVTAEMGFSLGGNDVEEHERPGVGPFEY
ncbi:MAG TPA: hypothetical protein VNJ47_05550 [Nevskiales bacterium]|nr:hypothetical protein [Nevskiales bacterium]